MDVQTHKKCLACHIVKPRTEFYVRSKDNVYHQHCKPCDLAKCYRPKPRWQIQRKNAAKRGYQWLLTLEEFERFLDKPCHYCEGPLGKSGSALDRIDNKKDYSVENCVPCCSVCNWIRQDVFDYLEMKKFGPTVKEIRVERMLAGREPPTLLGQKKKTRNVYKRRGLKSPWAYGPES